MESKDASSPMGEGNVVGHQVAVRPCAMTVVGTTKQIQCPSATYCVAILPGVCGNSSDSSSSDNSSSESEDDIVQLWPGGPRTASRTQS